MQCQGSETGSCLCSVRGQRQAVVYSVSWVRDRQLSMQCHGSETGICLCSVMGLRQEVVYAMSGVRDRQLSMQCHGSGNLWLVICCMQIRSDWLTRLISGRSARGAVYFDTPRGCAVLLHKNSGYRFIVVQTLVIVLWQCIMESKIYICVVISTVRRPY